MRYPPAFRVILLAGACTMAASGPSIANMQDTVNLLLRVCLAGGTSQQVEQQATGEVALTLNALKSGKIGGSAGIAAKYLKSDWVGLQGGINAGISQLQAQQADAARACLAPYMPGIVQAILEAR